MNLGEQFCTCRYWSLNGIPCVHLVCAMLHFGQDPFTTLDVYYKKEKYIASYQYSLQPVRGEIFWQDDENRKPMIPPLLKKQAGRPKRMRKKAPDEPRKGVYKGCSRKGQ